MTDPKDSNLNFSPQPPLRVCYFGTYREEYSRNQIMIEGLRRNGVQVLECHETLWHGIQDRVEATQGGWLKPGFWWRILKAYTRLLIRYLKIRDYDVLVVGYPGQFDVFLARLLSWLKGKPLVWDVFMSIYLIAVERDLQAKSGFTVNLIRRVEQIGMRLPDLLIQDTQEYVNWLAKTHGIPTGRFRLVPTGADDRVFKPISKPETLKPKETLVIYYGTFIPNHGVIDIIEAARLLEGHANIRFELIGQGPEQPRAKALSEEYQLKNTTFIDWMEKEALIQHIARAQVCLGAFGKTPQSLMTVQNKIYEGLAMEKAVVSGASPAVRQALQDGFHIYLCERGNPESLAQAICTLHEDPEMRRKLAQNGQKIFKEQFNLIHNGARYASHLREVYIGKSNKNQRNMK